MSLNLTAEESTALELLKAILSSDVDEDYKDLILSYYDDDDEYISSDDMLYIAYNLAYGGRPEVLPEEVRAYVKYVLELEAEKGNEDAALDLGSLYYTGRIGEQSYEKAVKYYKIAEEKGSLIASENLGYCYYYGRDVEVNYETAYKYFIKPALAGRLESMYKIGDMYAKGLYVDKDENFAYRLYKKAYDGIDADCDVVGDICLRMGNCSYYGTGCERDVHEALKYYQRSESEYYKQLENGDFFKRKILDGVIEKIDAIRRELLGNIDSLPVYNED